MKPIAMLVRACALSGVILLTTPSGSWAQGAGEALRNIEREMRDAPICQQMEGYSAQLANIRRETQEGARRSSWRRVCIILGQATGVLAEMITFMRSHIGECNITAASLLQTVAAASEMAKTRAQHCR